MDGYRAEEREAEEPRNPGETHLPLAGGMAPAGAPPPATQKEPGAVCEVQGESGGGEKGE